MTMQPEYRDKSDPEKEKVAIGGLDGELAPDITSRYPPKKRKGPLPKNVFPCWVDIPFPPFLPYERSNELEYPLQPPCLVKRAWHLRPKRQQSSNQTASRLMNLPLEIREMIFDQLIGRNSVHLWFNYAPTTWRGGRCGWSESTTDWPNRFLPMQMTLHSNITNATFRWNWYHSVCRHTQRSAGRAKKWHACLDNKYKYPHGGCRYIIEHINVEPHSRKRIDVMPYLLVCRRLYTEVAHYLYRFTIFNLAVNVYSRRRFGPNGSQGSTYEYPGRSLLLSLPELLPSVHFNTIATLDIEWMVEVSTGLYTFYPMPAYEQGWQVLASMKGLTRLYVHLSCWELEAGYPKDAIDLWIQPIQAMKQVKNLNKFHLCVGESFFRIFREDKDPCYVLDFAKDTWEAESRGYSPNVTAPPPYNDWRERPLITKEELLREYKNAEVIAEDRYSGRFINTPDDLADG